MVQLELPLVYPRVRWSANPPGYELPLRWKAVFILLLIYAMITSAIVYDKITQTRAETARPEVKATPAIIDNQAVGESTAPVAAGQVRMTATVPGWYDVVELDNANLLIKTNMQVWVNGREFIRCDDCDQEINPDLVDF